MTEATCIKLDQLEERVKKLEETFCLYEDIYILKEQLENSENNNKYLEELLKDEKTKSSGLDVRVTILTEQLEDSESENEQYQLTINRLDKDIEKRDKEIKKLEEDRRELRESVQRLTGMAQLAKINEINAYETIEDQDETIQLNDVIIEKLTEEIDQLRKENKELIDEKHSTKIVGENLELNERDSRWKIQHMYNDMLLRCFWFGDGVEFTEEELERIKELKDHDQYTFYKDQYKKYVDSKNEDRHVTIIELSEERRRLNEELKDCKEELICTLKEVKEEKRRYEEAIDYWKKKCEDLENSFIAVDGVRQHDEIFWQREVELLNIMLDERKEYIEQLEEKIKWLEDRYAESQQFIVELEKDSPDPFELEKEIEWIYENLHKYLGDDSNQEENRSVETPDSGRIRDNSSSLGDQSGGHSGDMGTTGNSGGETPTRDS